MAIQLIVGLRNPGAAYQDTRHNAGGWLVEALARHHNVSFKTEKKWHAEIAVLNQDSVSTICLLPLTFMNHSGLSVFAVSQFYGIEPHEILVAHDDLDIPVGRLKFKTGGGHGGHNGLRDIIQQLGTGAFHRLRLGIGHPGHKELVLNYVLGRPSQADRRLMEEAIERGIAVMPRVVSGHFDEVMRLLHG